MYYNLRGAGTRLSAGLALLAAAQLFDFCCTASSTARVCGCGKANQLTSLCVIASLHCICVHDGARRTMRRTEFRDLWLGNPNRTIHRVQPAGYPPGTGTRVLSTRVEILRLSQGGRGAEVAIGYCQLIGLARVKRGTLAEGGQGGGAAQSHDHVD